MYNHMLPVLASFYFHSLLSYHYNTQKGAISIILKYLFSIFYNMLPYVNHMAFRPPFLNYF